MVSRNKILKPCFLIYKRNQRYRILFHILKNSYKTNLSDFHIVIPYVKTNEKQQVQEGYHEQKISFEKT